MAHAVSNTMKSLHWLAAAMGTTALALLAPRDAFACGGCFGPPPQQMSVTVVTDHRMILSVSPQQTTLYDQIRYQGDPAAFAWVLPIHGTVDVGLSADVLFASLDAITATKIQSPPLNCPRPPSCGNRNSRSPALDSAGASDAAAPDPVTVNKRETVGPYDTAQISSMDPVALQNWLAMNGFNVPDDIKPVITNYVTEGFDFLAMKLIPGMGVASMRPVRVTTMGASPVLPLRMVAAGTGASVGITLWIIGEGRYEPSNFPSFTIPSTDLVWDWQTQSSNYTQLRAQKTAESNGAAWETESSFQVSRFQIQNFVNNGGIQYGGPSPASDDYLATTGPNPQTADQVRKADLDTLFFGITMGQERITRLRSDLARAALSKDLQVSASADQAMLFNQRVAAKSVNTPACPTFPPCPSDPVVDNFFGTGRGCATTTAASNASDVGLVFALGFVGIALVRARRRHNS